MNKLIQINADCGHINEIKHLKNRYQSLFEYSHDAIIIHDLKGKVIDVNKKTVELFGRTKEEFYTINTNTLPGKNCEKTCQKNMENLAEKGFIHFECEVMSKDNVLFPIEVSSNLIETEYGSIVQTIIRDIREKKRYQRELEDKNSELEKSKINLVEAQKVAHVGNWELDLKKNQLVWSEEVYRIFDIESDKFEASYESFLKSIHPDDKERVHYAYTKSIKDKKPYTIMHRIITKRGRLKYVEECCEHILDENQNIVRSIGTVQDITSRKLARIELKKSQKDFQSILENMQDTYYRSNLKGEITLVSGGTAKLLGYKENELLGKQLSTLYRYPSVRETFLKGIQKNNGKYSIKAELVHKNKNFVWVSTKAQYWYTDSGELGGVEGFVRDITEEKLAQVKEQNLLKLIDASSNEIYVFNKESLCINYVNQGGMNNIQYSMNELSSMHPYDIKPDFNEESFRAYIQPLINKEITKQNFKTTHERKDGSTYPVQIHLQLLNENFLAVIIDISEQEVLNKKLKEQEEIMLVQSRHAAMGEMISMIAHQWRQPISIVGMLSNTIMQGIKMDRMDSDSMQEDLKNINNQVQYMSKTIDDFRNFFQKSNAIEEVNLYDILEESNNILGAVLRRHNIQMHIECHKSIILYTYSRELIQVIINIISNAKDALGKVSGEKNISIQVVEKDENIKISIFNNGIPIEESIKTKIFEPYFTTKGNSGGTGLGLYMVKSILDKHMNGKITVKNKENGVEFNITLPKKLIIL